MKCHYCGNEMTMGYVQCGDGVRWAFNLQPVATLSILKKGKQFLCERRFGQFNT